MDNSRRNRPRRGALLGTFAGLLVGLALALTAGPLPAYLAVLSATTPSSSPTGPGRTLPATTAQATPTGLDRTLTVADYIIVVSASMLWTATETARGHGWISWTWKMSRRQWLTWRRHCWTKDGR